MKVRVTITGTRAYLQNRYPIEQAEENDKKLKSTKGGEMVSEEKKLKRKSYYDDTVGFYIPSDHVTACLRDTAKGFVLKGNKTYADRVKACVLVDEDKIPLNRKEWDRVHREVVRVPPRTGARVPGCWPCWDKWEATFTLSFEEISEDKMREMLEKAGVMKGVGDHRPKFGLFKVKEWEVLEQ